MPAVRELVSHHTSNDGKQSARRAIKSFLGVRMLHGRFYKKNPWLPGAKLLKKFDQNFLLPFGRLLGPGNG